MIRFLFMWLQLLLSAIDIQGLYWFVAVVTNTLSRGTIASRQLWRNTTLFGFCVLLVGLHSRLIAPLTVPIG